MKKITLMCGLLLAFICLKANAQTPPANDNLANATALQMGASCTNDFFTNTGSTAEANEPVASCFTGATHTVWFSFTAPASGAVNISTDILPGNIGDTQIALYPAPTNVNDLSTLPAEVGCDQDGGTLVSNGGATYMSVLELGGLVSGDTYYIQVDGWNGAIGDFCIQVDEVTCPNPSNVSVSNITENSAGISWTENGSATIWDIELGLAGFTPTGTPTANDVSNPYLATMLAKNTFYEVYVRADCGGGDVSEWIGPVGFTTICAGLPYIETFSSGTFPDCWTRSNTNNVTIEASCGPRNGVLHLQDDSEAVSVSLDATVATKDLRVSYYIGAEVCGAHPDDIFLVEYWDGTTWIVAKSYDPTVSGSPFLQTYINDFFIVPMSVLTADFKLRFNSNDNSTGDDWSIDDLVVEEIPTCLVPFNLSATNITTTSADLSWIDNNAPTAGLWDVEVVVAGTAPTGTPTATGVANPYTVTGLVACQNYEFYVRADCGAGDLSRYAGPFQFSTASGPIGDFSENFDAVPVGSLPICWNSLISSTSTSPFVQVQGFDSFSAPNNLGFSNSFDTSAGLYAITPQLTDLPNGTHQLRFQAKTDVDAVLEVGTMTDPTNAATFTSIQTLATTTSYHEFIVLFNGATTDMYVAFKGTFTGTFSGSNIDDVFWEPIPPCPKPNALTVSNITPTSADLGWTDNAGVTLWDIEVVLAGTPPTGTPTDPAVTSNPYTKAGLSPGTAYEFYVRADCGTTNGTSVYEGPFAFSTPCLSATLPYTESFSSGSFPICWTRSSTTNVTVMATCGSRSNVLRFDFSEEATTVPIDASGVSNGLKVSYYIADSVCGFGACCNEVFNVDYWDGTQWVAALTYNSARPDAYTFEFFFVPQSDVSNSFKVRFDQIDGTTDTWLIDDLVVQETPSCSQPTNLTASNITTNTADLGWTDNAGATLWDVEIVPAGTAPTGTPTATGVPNPYPAMVLSPSTSYDFYVRADCGGGDLSSWAGPFTFSTLCGVVTIPYTESFTGGIFPSCWTRSSTTDVTVIGSCGSRTDVLRFDFSEEAITGPIDASSSTTGLKVSYYIADSVCGFGACCNEKFNVDYWDGTQWVNAKIYDSSRPDAYTFEFFFVPQSDVSVDFKVRFDQIDGTTDTWLIDNVIVQETPTCSLPTILTATSITSSTAVLGWTDNNTPPASLWDVELVLAGNAPTGTPTNSGVTNPYNATGLNAATDYEFYVRADCGGGDVSVWSGPFAFTTDCGTVNAPISEDFASSITPFCWIEGGITPWTYSLGADFAASAAGDHTPGGGTNYAWMDGSDNEDGEASTLTSYPVDISGLSQPALEFYLFSDNTNDSAINIVEVEIFDGLNFYKVLHLATLLGPAWEHYLIDLSGYNFAGPIQVIFTVTGNAEGGDTQHNDILLDDVAFLESTCPDPTNITFGNIDFTSVDVSWAPGGTETEWEVEYGTAGFNPGTGIVVIDNDGTPSTSLTGLEPGTDYDVYVSAVCSPDTSSQSLPASFTTNLDCPAITNFAVTAGPTSIDLTWTPGGTETGWIIEFGPAGFTPGTGTVVIDSDGPGEFIIGLIPDTDYDVYVTPICSGKNGDLFGPSNFTTQSLGIDEAVFEGFAFFPNPVQNRLSLQAIGEIEKVGIYNLLGQRVLMARPESPTFEMDLGGLQTGAYLMKVRISGSQAVFKLIKE